MYGLKRNPNQLYQWYIQRFRDNPQDRPNIPTTNRATVYAWFKEDRWEERVKLEEIEILDRSAETYRDLRQRGYELLNSHMIDAITELHQLVKPDKDRKIDPKVQLDAIKTLLDRVGMNPERAQQNRHTVGTPAEEPISDNRPPDDADEDALMKFLASNARETN